MKNKLASIVLVLMVALTFCNCEKNSDLLGNWRQLSSLNARGRGGAACFVIDNKAYLVGGAGYYKTVEYYKETWQFNPETRSWTEYASIDTSSSIKGRMNGAGFAINGKGYFGTGYGKDATYFDDFYEFDPEGKTTIYRSVVQNGDTITKLDTLPGVWKATDKFPGGKITGTISFAINNIGYVGTGYTKELGASNTFYSYNPENADGKKWERVENINATKRQNACVFIIDDIAYIFGGVNNSIGVEDFERFNPAEPKGDYRWFKVSQDLYDDYRRGSELLRQRAVAFSINGRGYISCGTSSAGGTKNDTWEYIPFVGSDNRGEWIKVASFEGSNRYNACSFVVNNEAYILCGQNGASESSYYDDVWTFDPTQDYDEKKYK